jgi:hypothetical protein
MKRQSEGKGETYFLLPMQEMHVKTCFFLFLKGLYVKGVKKFRQNKLYSLFDFDGGSP